MIDILPARSTSSQVRSPPNLQQSRAFVEIFYMAWEVVAAFIAADAQMPKEVALPRPAARQVARYLVDRREHPVSDVIEALEPLSQRELIKSEVSAATVVQSGGSPAAGTVGTVLAPSPTGLTAE